MRRRPIKERVERIRQLASVGWTAQRIADKLGLDRKTVYGYANLYEIAIPRQVNPYWEERRRIRRAILDYVRANPKTTQVAAAAALGVSPATVAAALRREGIAPVRQYDQSGNLVDRKVPPA